MSGCGDVLAGDPSMVDGGNVGETQQVPSKQPLADILLAGHPRVTGEVHPRGRW